MTKNEKIREAAQSICNAWFGDDGSGDAAVNDTHFDRLRAALALPEDEPAPRLSAEEAATPDPRACSSPDCRWRGIIHIGSCQRPAPSAPTTAPEHSAAFKKWLREPVDHGGNPLDFIGAAAPPADEGTDE